MISERLHRVQRSDDGDPVDNIVGVVKKLSNVFLAELSVDETQLFRQHAVEQDAPGTGFHPPLPDSGRIPFRILAEKDLRIDMNRSVVEGDKDVLDIREVHSLAIFPGTEVGQVEYSEHDVLRRNDDRFPARRRHEVARRKHEQTRLRLRFDGERNVNRHLVSIEIRIERRTDHRVQAYRFPFHEDGLESLNPEPVQCRRTVQHDRVVPDDLFQNPPDLVPPAFDQTLGAFHVRRKPLFDKLPDHEGLEEFKRHLFRQSALVELELRPDDDDRPAGVIHALSEQILPEAPLFSAEKIREALQGAVSGPEYGLPHTAVIDQRIDGLLEHPLLVANDNFRRMQFLKFAKPVVPVDDSAVQVVQIRGGEPTAVKLNHRA